MVTIHGSKCLQLRSSLPKLAAKSATKRVKKEEEEGKKREKLLEGEIERLKGDLVKVHHHSSYSHCHLQCYSHSNRIFCRRISRL